MVITLYRSEGNVLKLGKHLDTVGEINGHFRGATSLTSPEITIALREYNFNYLSFIFGGRRYYYFLSDHPTIDGDKMILHCDLDRLQTYYDEIIELEGTCERTAKKWRPGTDKLLHNYKIEDNEALTTGYTNAKSRTVIQSLYSGQPYFYLTTTN